MPCSKRCGPKLGSKRLLWERMRALFYAYALTSMRQLFEALLYGFKKSSPLVDDGFLVISLHVFCDRVPSTPGALP